MAAPRNGQAGAPAAASLRRAGVLEVFLADARLRERGARPLGRSTRAGDGSRCAGARLLWLGMLAPAQNAYAVAQALLMQRLTLSRELGIGRVLPSPSVAWGTCSWRTTRVCVTRAL